MNEVDAYQRYNVPNPHASSEQKKWHRLYELVPVLRRICVDPLWNNHPPRAMDRQAFVSLVACLNDPDYREVLRALLFDLLMNDFIDLITPTDEEVSA